MLNQEMDSVLLVKGWKKGANWSFPRGKINKHESDLDCAIREVYEETGFDINETGLASTNQEDQKYIEITMREQHMRLYVFRGVPMDFEFAPRTRKEISKIQWYRLSELPTIKKGKPHQDAQTDDLATNANKYYMVAPFLGHLKKWIGQQRKEDKAKETLTPAEHVQIDERTNETEQEVLQTGTTQTHGEGDMARLLAGLRGSEQVTEALATSNEHGGSSRNLMSLLGLPSKAKVYHEDTPHSEHPEYVAHETPAEQKVTSSDLLSLLRRGPTNRTRGPPETPADQLLQNPLDPPSPKLEHQQASLHRPPMGPKPQAFPIFPSQTGVSMPQQRPQLHMAPSLPQVNQLTKSDYHVRPQKTATTFLGPQVSTSYASDDLSRANPTNPHTGHAHPPTAQIQRATVPHQIQDPPINLSIETLAVTSSGARAPYQRTGDPDFARPSEASAIKPRIIPPASKLPPPKLTNHTSSLLSLFKSPAPPQELSTAAVTHPSKHVSTADLIPVTPLNDARDIQRVSAFHEKEKPRREFSHQIVDQQARDQQLNLFRANSQHDYSVTSANLLHPQRSKRAIQTSSQALKDPLFLSSEVVEAKEAQTVNSNTQASTSAHQNALLDLFRKPSASDKVVGNVSKEADSASLQLPPSSFELSALPNTPGHSREPSRVQSRPNQKLDVELGSSLVARDRIDPRHPQILQRVVQDSNATVDGPLNIPQFELIHHAKEARNGSIRTKRQTQHIAQQQTPITILQRPSSKGAGRRPQQSPDRSPGPNGETRAKGLAGHKAPNTPRSNAAPSFQSFTGPVQPQILRRPIHHVEDQDLAAPSPVSPLPSPKHPTLLTRQGNKQMTPQHKQSLLAMFSRPGPESNPDPSQRPLPSSASTHEAASPLASKSHTTSNLHRRESRLGSMTSSTTRVSHLSHNPGEREMAMGGSSSGDGRATPHGVTPTDKHFLLNFLGDVARGGK